MTTMSWKKQECHSAWNKNYGSEFRTKVRTLKFPLLLMSDFWKIKCKIKKNDFLSKKILVKNNFTWISCDSGMQMAT